MCNFPAHSKCEDSLHAIMRKIEIIDENGLVLLSVIGDDAAQMDRDVDEIKQMGYDVRILDV